MLEELSLLLDAVPFDAARRRYADAAVADNCLSKRTASNRAISFQHLKELYALDPNVPLFRVLRRMWADHAASRPLLALLLALARDPLLRTTATAVLPMAAGSELPHQPIKETVAEAVGARLNDSTLDKVVRNALSSWTQSGHLRGRSRKIRQAVEASPAVTAFALLIAYATGRRGQRLFESPWAAVLDSSPAALSESALDARKLGLLDFKQSGSMMEVAFPALLTARDRRLMHGTH